MKILILILILCSVKITIAQDPEADLNGKIFRGSVTEITPPDVDRMPMFYNELLRFENGKIYSEVLKAYSVMETGYSSEFDDRRMIAVKVISFKSFAAGKFNGQNVNIEVSGNVYGDAKLAGNVIMKYQDNREIKFIIEAVAE